MCEEYQIRGTPLTEDQADDRWHELTENDGERTDIEPWAPGEYKWWSRSQLKFPETAGATDLVKRLRMVLIEHRNKACPKVQMETRYQWEVAEVLRWAGMPCDMVNRERLNIMTDLPWQYVLLGTDVLEATDADPAERMATVYMSLAIEAYLRSQLGALEDKTLYYAELVQLAWEARPKLLTDNEAAACLVLGKGRNFAAHTVDKVPEEKRRDPMLAHAAVTFNQMRSLHSQKGGPLTNEQMPEYWDTLMIFEDPMEQTAAAINRERMAPRAAPRTEDANRGASAMATRLGNNQKKRAPLVASSLPELDWDLGPAPRKVLTPDQLRDEVRRRWLGAAVHNDMSRSLAEKSRCMREAQEELALMRQEI